jgi:CheY-like chemotaxis protein
VNARDAMPEGGRLTIATHRDGDSRVRLVVTDTGVGMDEETRSRAFEPFFTTKGQRGTGLGLSTVYGIVSGAEGTIDIDSRPGAGCTVRISLPREDEKPVVSTEIEADTIHGTGTVLVAEDGADLRETIGEALRAFGYRPLLAEHAADALRVLSDAGKKVDFLLTDVVMPGMSGVELAARALELRPSLNVLFMSGYAPDPRHRALFGREGTAFLQKPFTPMELAARLAAFRN